MVQIIRFVSFFAILVIGSLVADALGRLADAGELEVQDRQRFRATSETTQSFDASAGGRARWRID